MKNNNKKILVGILTGAMLLTSVTAVSAASVRGSRSSSMMGISILLQEKQSRNSSQIWRSPLDLLTILLKRNQISRRTVAEF